MTSTPRVILESATSSCSNSSNCVNTKCGESLHSLIENLDKVEETPATTCSMPNLYSCPNDRKKKRPKCCNSTGQTIWGVILVVTSVIGFIFPPLDFLLWERLNMRPGFPPFDMWADPPDEVKMRAHIFNVTNHERFLQGLDDKINMEEIGPFVYLEKLKHYNMKFHENSTMSYTAKRYLIFLPEENTIDFNATVISPNVALLGILSYLHNANYFVRTGFKLLANTHNTQVFVKKTIYEYLWDNRDPILDTSKNLAPAMVPDTNMGMLTQIYADFTDEYTVKIGPQWGHKNFFTIDNVGGRSHIAGYDPDKCPDRLNGATEGVIYHQHVTKDDVLLCLRKTVCKLMPLHYEREAVMKGINVYKFSLPENVFDRNNNGTDCYSSNPPLPDGISDTSNCLYNFPMVASFPHFYTGSPPKDKYVTGLKPNKSKHSSFIYLEPNTGIPFRAVARLQCNLQVNDLSGFYSQEMNKFSNLILPLGWIEYSQEGLPVTIVYLVYFMIVILPPLSVVIFILTLIIGVYLIMKQIVPNKLKKKLLIFVMLSKKHKNKSLAENNKLAYEKENFIKNSIIVKA